jgi:tetratricopeptide (TPR) repeat protein
MPRRAALLLALFAAPAPLPAQTPPRGAAEIRQAQLDQLFEALKAAPDAQGAQMVEARIRALWSRAISPAAALLLQRGVRNIQANATADALEDFDAALVLEPGAAEGWLLRAQAYSRLGDTATAARDLQQALRLEPRHFGALLQLSQLQEETGDLRGALRSLDAALALHPKLPDGDQRRRDLVRRVEGVAL